MATNPFYVQPASYGQQLSGLAGTLRDYGEQQKTAKRFAEAKSAAVEAFNSGDPDRIAEAYIQYPELAKAMQLRESQIYRDETTRENAIQAGYDYLMSPTVENAEELAEARKKELRARGLTEEEMAETNQFLELARQDPAMAAEKVRQGLMVADNERFRQIFPSEDREKTANIKDFQYYTQLKEQGRDAEAAMFARKTGMLQDDDKPTQLMKNIGYMKSLPEDSPEREAVEKALGITKEMTPQQKIKVEEALQEKVVALEGTKDALDFVQTFFNKEGDVKEEILEPLTGIRGRLPTVQTSSFDAETKLEQLIDMLTVENLEKMSGVLSDSDIKILRSASSGLRPGMSKEAMQQKIKQIKNIFRRKYERTKKQLPDPVQDAVPVSEMDTEQLKKTDFGAQ